MLHGFSNINIGVKIQCRQPVSVQVPLLPVPPEKRSRINGKAS